ncbi:MAG: DUF975 family protein [Treponema sp.]|nr:DUF975 family protein [Treponema sp.]
MFNRAEYKARALEQLKGRWKGPCIVTAASVVVLFGFEFASSLLAKSEYGIALSQIAGLFFVAAIAIINMVFAYVHLKLSRSLTPITSDDVLVAIGDYSVKGILGLLWYNLWVSLWALLFYIPGIVKTYAYSQMFFVMIENPDIGPRKAMNISKVLTNGHKADLFVMDLSFWGWSLLCIISLGIGAIWLVPYMMTAKANAYTALKTEALESGRLKIADFAK